MQVTDEQARAASKLYYATQAGPFPSMKVALESLQLDPPTEEEVRLVYAQTPGTIVGTMLMREALRNFVNLRNNPPKSNPRREAILKALEPSQKVWIAGESANSLADKILKALDEVK